MILLIVVLVVVAIFIIVGMVCATIIAFLLVNKILKRHISLLRRRAEARELMVADLDNEEDLREAGVSPEETSMLSKQHHEEQRVANSHSIQDPDLKKHKGEDAY